MNLNRIYRTAFSLLTIVAILLGSTGFVIQSHECSHTGLKDYSIIGNQYPDNACCGHNEAVFCVFSSEEENNSTNGLYSQESCCKHEIAGLQLPGFTIAEKDSGKQLQPVTNAPSYILIPEERNHYTGFDIPYHNKHGGKFKLLINCQFLA